MEPKQIQPSFTKYEVQRAEEELAACGWNISRITDKHRLMALRKLGLRQ
jgi:hypothetical protein